MLHTIPMFSYLKCKKKKIKKNVNILRYYPTGISLGPAGLGLAGG